MTLLRRRIFPLFAVCVALAVGVALGAGPLQGGDAAGSDDASAQAADLSDQVASLRAGQQFSEAMSAAAAPGWLSNTLMGQAVTVIALPGVDEAVVTAYQATIRRAGGLPVVTARIAADYADSAKKTYVDSVATSSLRGLVDLKSYTGAAAFTKIGALVARGYVGQGDAVAWDDESVKIDSELQGADLVSVAGEPRRRGNLVLVLAAGEHGTDDDTEATHLIETELATQLAAAADGLVVVAPPGAALAGGLLEALDSSRWDALPAATVSVQEGVDARIAAIYAVKAAAAGNGGAFGVDGSDVVLPPEMTITGR